MKALDVSVDKRAYLPGERVQVLIRLQTDIDLAIRQGLAHLQYRNRYKYHNVDYGDSDASHSVVMATKRFQDEETIPAGDMREWTVSLTVPDRGPPSVRLPSTEVAWLARVDLDVRGRDLHADTDFWVYAPLSAASRSEKPGMPMKLEAGKWQFELQLPSRTFLAGEEIKGTLIITARKSMTASKVLVKLVRRDEFDDRAANVRSAVDEADLSSAQSLHLAAGESREFPFSLQLPRDACPSFRAEKSTVWWGIDCTALHWLSRPSATLPIEVYNLSVP